MSHAEFVVMVVLVMRVCLIVVLLIDIVILVYCYGRYSLTTLEKGRKR